jgi:hypothetical protein
MDNKELIAQLNKELAADLSPAISTEVLHTQLAAFINQLIQHDFEKLIFLLYRIDVSEAKIKSLLQHNPDEAAGNMIASLIIERQLEKIKTRQQFRKADDEFTEEEKW